MAPDDDDDITSATDNGESGDPDSGASDSSIDFSNGDSFEAVYDVPVEITAVLGTSNMKVSQLLKLGRGAVVELDQKVDEEIELRANNRLVARGEVVVVEEHLGVTMTDILKSNLSQK